MSRRFIKATAEKLKQFQERPLEDYDFVAVFLDGKTFADEEMLIALGVTMDGQKIPLGFVQTATENERVCRQLIQDLIRRGLHYDQGLLFVMDGSKGLRSDLPEENKKFVFDRVRAHHGTLGSRVSFTLFLSVPIASAIDVFPVVHRSHPLKEALHRC